MARDWSSLIHEALAGVADDPYVRLLKERLRSGSQVVRISLVNSGSEPEYVVILSLQRQLSEMRLPHSDAFTSWSLDAGARLTDEAQEMERFALLLDERFAPLREELEASSFDFLLVQHVVRELGPPRSAAAAQPLRLLPFVPPQESRTRLRAIQRIEDVLVNLARALGRSLRYDEAATSRILDGALLQWMNQHLHMGTQEEAFPE
ncbi:hypothetical protein [Hyalangium rubrum]|uniref:Uncharacterized protein n=1 Tax=Hyalangium rubrum TaxID=3103134 RepID=A0ABU5GZW8_9BACT|nr:hypothetical protein [Hyalangium sp. s54d21]MDY7226745.1 hypothetical protein [Hyalangium sp. s54d21]